MDYNNIAKKIKQKRLVCGLAFVAVSIALIFIQKYWLYTILELINLAVYLLALSRVSNLQYIIDDLCNPQLYYATYCALYKRQPFGMTKMRLAELMGDYSLSINTAYSLYMNSKSDRQKFVYLISIMRTSFDAGDFALCEKAINEIGQINIDEKIKFKYYNVIGFYSHFIKAHYAEASQCLDAMKSSVPFEKQSNLMRNKFRYYDALIAHCLGDIDTASQCFNDVTSAVPGLYIASLAQFIMQTGAMPNSKIKPVSDDESKQIAASNNQVFKRLVWLVVIVIGFIIVLIINK